MFAYIIKKTYHKNSLVLCISGSDSVSSIYNALKQIVVLDSSEQDLCWLAGWFSMAVD